MNSSLIGKIDKARRYAQERERIRFESLAVDFHGENDTHRVSLEGERWHCTCDFFAGWGACAHSMALERILDVMLPEGARHQELAKT